MVESAPQSFGQSFASSSIVKPNGQVISSSIYTDSEGNRVVNGKNPVPQFRIPPIANDLLPPLIPGEIIKPFVLPFQQFQPLIPVIQPSVPVTTRPTARITTTIKSVTTKRPSAAPLTTSRPSTTRSKAPVKQPAKSISNSLNSIDGGAYVHDESGVYVHDITAGSYVHDKQVGAYVPDDRGKYRRQ